jgi:hypothetical protein
MLRKRFNSASMFEWILERNQNGKKLNFSFFRNFLRLTLFRPFHTTSTTMMMMILLLLEIKIFFSQFAHRTTDNGTFRWNLPEQFHVCVYVTCQFVCVCIGLYVCKHTFFSAFCPISEKGHHD